MSVLATVLAVVPEEPPVVDNTVELSEWIAAGVIIVVGVLLASGVGRLVRKVLRGIEGTNSTTALFVSRLAAYVMFIVAVLYALAVLDVRIVPLVGAIGIGGLVLALATQRLFEDVVAGVVLHARRPFIVGESIQHLEHVGRVVDVDARTTVIDTIDGEIVRVPNMKILTEASINLTRPKARRSKVVVGVAYDTDLEHAHGVLLGAVSTLDRVLLQPPPQVMLSDFGESSINFTLYVWHESDILSELATRHDVILAAHKSLDAAGITIAFPQMVVWSSEERGADGRVYSSEAAHRRTDFTGAEASSSYVRRSRRWRRRAEPGVAEPGSPGDVD